jgi:hypothetical protein
MLTVSVILAEKLEQLEEELTEKEPVAISACE